MFDEAGKATKVVKAKGVPVEIMSMSIITKLAKRAETTHDDRLRTELAPWLELREKHPGQYPLSRYNQIHHQVLRLQHIHICV